MIVIVGLMLGFLIGCNQETTVVTTTTTSSLSTTQTTTATGESTNYSTTTTTSGSLTIQDRINALENKYNIGLFITESPYDSIGINFSMPAETTAYVEISELGVDSFTRIATTDKSRAIGKKFAYLFEATLTGLIPGETYVYRVTNEDGSETSDLYQFTMPTTEKDSFSFMYLADPQENSEVGYMAYGYAVMTLLDEIDPEYDFAMFPGDLVDNADIKSEWELFFKYSSIFSYAKPIVATTGNHDANGFSEPRIAELEFDGYLNLPNNGPLYNEFNTLIDDERAINFDDGKTYSFDYGDAHFVVINTEMFCDGTTACLSYDENNAAVLKNWITGDLSLNEKPWTIVLLHRGPYSLSYDTYNVRDNFAPIFDQFGVDLVIAGHDHQYSRAVYFEGSRIDFKYSSPYSRGQVFLNETSENEYDLSSYSESLGTTYLTGNTSGTKYYGGDKSSGIAVNYQFSDEQPVIPIITVYEDKIEIVSYVILKDTALTIVPSGIEILETFTINKE